MCVPGITEILFWAFAPGIRLLAAAIFSPVPSLREGLIQDREQQSGAARYALFALLLLRLPVVLTFHALFELPRLAERSLQFCAISLQPFMLNGTFCTDQHRFLSTLEPDS